MVFSKDFKFFNKLSISSITKKLKLPKLRVCDVIVYPTISLNFKYPYALSF